MPALPLMLSLLVVLAFEPAPLRSLACECKVDGSKLAGNGAAACGCCSACWSGCARGKGSWQKPRAACRDRGMRARRAIPIMASEMVRGEAAGSSWLSCRSRAEPGRGEGEERLGRGEIAAGAGADAADAADAAAEPPQLQCGTAECGWVTDPPHHPQQGQESTPAVCRGLKNSLDPLADHMHQCSLQHPFRVHAAVILLACTRLQFQQTLRLHGQLHLCPHFPPGCGRLCTPQLTAPWTLHCVHWHQAVGSPAPVAPPPHGSQPWKSQQQQQLYVPHSSAPRCH
mmetsp:Transcript_11816/g.32226  ORF Transcript_11816/g.32226 Transcript_11816/m.32226 type:complete len:285 (+) Transcript_11816:762-1616(+)